MQRPSYTYHRKLNEKLPYHIQRLLSSCSEYNNSINHCLLQYVTRYCVHHNISLFIYCDLPTSVSRNLDRDTLQCNLTGWYSFQYHEYSRNRRLWKFSHTTRMNFSVVLMIMFQNFQVFNETFELLLISIKWPNTALRWPFRQLFGFYSTEMKVIL